MEAEIGAEDRRELAGLEREGRVLERLHHLAALEESEVAARLLRAGVFGGRAGELREVLAGHEPRSQRFRLLPALLDRLGGRPGLDPQQDVARVDLLGDVVGLEPLLVERLGGGFPAAEQLLRPAPA